MSLVVNLYYQCDTLITSVRSLNAMQSMKTSGHWNVFCLSDPLWGESTAQSALCKGKAQRATHVELECFFNVILLNKQCGCRWIETPWCDVTVMFWKLTWCFILLQSWGARGRDLGSFWSTGTKTNSQNAEGSKYTFLCSHVSLNYIFIPNYIWLCEPDQCHIWPESLMIKSTICK